MRDVATVSIGAAVDSEARTSRRARFGIGFFCCCWLLIWMPWCYGIVGQLSFGWWFDVGQWTITHILGLPEHYSATRYSADILTHYVSTAVFVLVSAVVAALWMTLDERGLTHRAAFSCAFVAARFTLAALMLAYGWVKVLPAQFGLMASGAGTDYLMQQVGQLPPADLMWAFMEASRPYQVATGLVELLGGLLLLTRRTTMWGAFVSVAVMTNVLLMNFGYDVVVKFFSGVMLSLALAISAPYARGLGSVLARHAAGRSPQGIAVARSHRVRTVTRLLGVFVACLLVWWTYRGAEGVADRFARLPAQTPLHGIWDVEEVVQAGVPVPLLITDRSLWRRLVLPWGGTEAGAMLVWMSDAVTRCRSRIDTQANTLVIEPVTDSTVVGSVRSVPQAPARMLYNFTVVSPDQLLLMSADADHPAVSIRLRRFDHSTYALVAHRRGWRW